MENEKKKLIIQNLEFNKVKNNILVKIILSKSTNLFVLITCIIILFILSLFVFNFYLEKYKKELQNENDENNNMGNYSLYNIFEYPKISILLQVNIDNYNLDNIINLIYNLKNQKNLEIFILSKTQFDYNIMKNISKSDKRIKSFLLPKKDIIDNIFHVIKKVKGKFIIIINNSLTLEMNKLEVFYNFSRGKINNIFKFKTKNEINLYLIKTKILRDIIDNDISFQNFDNLFSYIIDKQEPKLNYISVGFCPNNYYTPYTYVAMISILNSKFYSTYISFYLIIPEDFTQNNIDFLY